MVPQDTGLTSDYFERRFEELNTSQHEQVGSAKCPAVLPSGPISLSLLGTLPWAHYEESHVHIQNQLPQAQV